MRSYSLALQGTLFLCAIAGILLVYSLGWGGTLQFDDEANLSGLATFQHSGDWLAWISSGGAGPSGRPIALASFLLDGLNWPEPAAFLRTNTLIHGLNGLLLGLVFLRLATLLGLRAEARAPVALGAALLWLTLPLLASSSLLIVQRMTTLAATFMLLGLYLYLAGRVRLSEKRNASGLALVWLGVVAGTGLGFLTKEHAALLPLLILVLEVTLLHERPRAWWWQVSVALLLVLPTVLVLAYLAQRIPNANFSNRDFTLSERLATQSVVLWDYLRLMFLPRSTGLSPFHDAYPIYSWSDSAVALATAGWIAAVALALALLRWLPLFSFAVFWFLGAHLIESTVVPLELYFEHRNYVPAIGPVFALALALYYLGQRFNLNQLVVTAGVAYLLLMGAVLAQTTSQWGQPALAAELWYAEAPDSKRAANFLARQHIANRDPNSAFRVLEWTREFHPDSAGLSLQLLQLSCQMHPPEKQLQQLAYTMDALRTGVVDTAAIDTIHLLKRFVGRNECPETLDLETLETMATLALQNPRLRGGRASRANFNLFLAEIQIERRDLQATMEALERALAAVPDLHLLAVAMAVLNSAGLEELALEFAQQREFPTLRHPLKRLHWEREYQALLDEQRAVIQERQGHRGTPTRDHNAET